MERNKPNKNSSNINICAWKPDIHYTLTTTISHTPCINSTKSAVVPADKKWWHLANGVPKSIYINYVDWRMSAADGEQLWKCLSPSLYDCLSKLVKFVLKLLDCIWLDKTVYLHRAKLAGWEWWKLSDSRLIYTEWQTSEKQENGEEKNGRSRSGRRR